MSVKPASPSAGRWQGWIAFFFLAVVALLCTQTAVVLYGPAKVIVSPFGYHGPHQIGEVPYPKEEVPDELVQQPGLYVIDWAVFDQCAYKLDDGRTLPVAEGAVALLILLALPLLLQMRGRLLWPRWPLWLLCGLGLLSVLNADSFMGAAIELVQWILVLLATWWLAAAAVSDEEQVRGLGRWLTLLTVVMVAWAGFDFYRYVLLPPAGAELPTHVRAACASRTAFGGLMVLLLPLAFAKVVQAHNLIVKAGYLVLFVAGLSVLTASGAVIAVVAAAVYQASTRGWKPAVAALILVPALALGAGWSVSKQHLRQLAESVQLYQRAPDGTPYAVEKRYLEQAAALNALTDARYVLPPGATQEEGGAEIIGYRSNLIGGVGAGQNYQRAIGGYYGSLDNPEKQEPDTYNLYLLLAVQVGLFGALAWAWVLFDGVALGRQALRGLPDERLQTLALGIAGSCVAVLVFSLYGTVLVRGVGALLAVLLATGARLAGFAPVSVAVTERSAAGANRAEVASSETLDVTE